MMRNTTGFSLIELVIIIVVIGIGVVSLSALFSHSATSLTSNETLQQVTQYAQECAERTLQKSRADAAGFASVDTTVCNALAALPTGFSRTVVVTPITGTGSPCPIGGTANCKDVLITVTSGGLSSAITVMLVK